MRNRSTHEILELYHRNNALGTQTTSPSGGRGQGSGLALSPDSYHL